MEALKQQALSTVLQHRKTELFRLSGQEMSFYAQDWRPVQLIIQYQIIPWLGIPMAQCATTKADC
jgi:hypothetical protein